MKERWIYRKALQYWGTEIQIVMAIEEMAELTKELTKFLRGKQNRLNICEEIADVEIMISQIKEAFDKGEVKNLKERKLERLKRMIEENPTAKDVVEGWE